MNHFPRNEESIKRAKIILEKIGYITVRIKERDKARKQLQSLLKKLEKNNTKNKIDRLRLLIENVFKKEANLIKNNFYESEKIKELRKIIYKLSKEHEKALKALDYMKSHNKEYLKLKKLQEKREKILEMKIALKMNTKIKNKLNSLENKYFEYKTSGQYSESVLNKLKNRIEKIKATLS